MWAIFAEWKWCGVKIKQERVCLNFAFSVSLNELKFFISSLDEIFVRYMEKKIPNSEHKTFYSMPKLQKLTVLKAYEHTELDGYMCVLN